MQVVELDKFSSKNNPRRDVLVESPHVNLSDSWGLIRVWSKTRLADDRPHKPGVNLTPIGCTWLDQNLIGCQAAHLSVLTEPRKIPGAWLTGRERAVEVHLTISKAWQVHRYHLAERAKAIRDSIQRE